MTKEPNDTPFVALAGGANIDIHGRSAQAICANDSNPGEVYMAAGGVACNVAENIARLGIGARLISAVGDDQHGRMLLHLSREAGINVQAVHIIPVARTSTYLSILDDKGDMLYAVNDMQIMDMLDVDLLRGQLAMLQQASLLVIDANLPADTLDWLLACCQEVPVFADTVSTAKAPRLRQFVQQIHTLKTGTIEVEALTGLPANSIAQLEEIANRLHKEGLRRLFITRGDKGVFYSDGNTQGSRATHAGQYDIRNAGGAGDAFLAGLVYSWMQDTSLQETLRFATAAAAITVQYTGTNHPELSVRRVNEIMGLEHA